MKKVLVAMSGGVDSSVAAALLKKLGYDVTGVTMQIWDKRDERCETEDANDVDARNCCSVSAASDAKRVAAMLGIPHYTLNMRKLFAEKVIKDFVEEYGRGRTPNPCIRCNEHLKFDALVRKADELGADHVATGHYARIKGEGGKLELLKAKDRKKDQSYVLYMLGQELLARVLFPLGEMTKKNVRAIARELGLPVADKEESQEICFVPNDDYVSFLEARLGRKVRGGDIIDTKGRTVGRHRGIFRYTIGQRRGLGISSPAPLYVTAIDAGRDRIIVGSRREALGSELVAGDVKYVSRNVPPGRFAARAKIRYNAKEAAATVAPLGADRCRVTFRTPQHAITPGQSVVFYVGERVVGGGTIEERTA